MTDFVVAGLDVDLIDLEGAKSTSNFRDLRVNHLEQQGDNTWIIVGKRDILILEGISVDDLGREHFII